MPSHLSTIGFEVQTQEDFSSLAEQIVGQAQVVTAKPGRYLRWAGKAGEELWLQVDGAGDLVGMNPHFSGMSSVRIGMQTRIRREKDTPLDGAFQGWAAPEGDAPDSGAYPFVFDSPDAHSYSQLHLPGIAEAQIAAFAHEIAFYDSPDAFDAFQKQQELKFASRSFIPSGLFAPSGTNLASPESHAVFTGHVIEGGVRQNSITGRAFYWALVDTLGGSYDVVIDKSLLVDAPTAGGILSGTFWLSGRLVAYPRRKRTWFGRLLGDAG